MRREWVALSSAQWQSDRGTERAAVVSAWFLLPQGRSHTKRKDGDGHFGTRQCITSSELKANEECGH